MTEVTSYSHDFEVPAKLKEEYDIKRIAKEGSTILIQMDGKALRFDIHSDSWTKTITGYHKQAKRLIPDEKVRFEIEDCLSGQWLKLLENGNGNQEQGQQAILFEEEETEQQTIDPSKDLDPYISDKDYAEFIIRTVKKTVKQEDSLVRQIVYTALSKDSSNPQNLAVLAPTSEGKTHAVLETLKIFPKNRL